MRTTRKTPNSRLGKMIMKTLKSPLSSWFVGSFNSRMIFPSFLSENLDFFYALVGDRSHVKIHPFIDVKVPKSVNTIA